MFPQLRRSTHELDRPATACPRTGIILATACYEDINANVIEDDEEEVTPKEFIELHKIIDGLTLEGETTA